MTVLLELHRAAFCRRHGVARLHLFGSATGEHFDPATSDLDFVVAFADTSPGYANRYLSFAEALEDLSGREADLVTERFVQDPSFRRAVASTQQLVYERANEEAPV